VTCSRRESAPLLGADLGIAVVSDGLEALQPGFFGEHDNQPRLPDGTKRLPWL
jgi:hypothetical protein